MSVKEYVFKRLEEGEFDLNLLFRQARIQFPSSRIGFAYIRQIRNEWRRSTASLTPASPGCENGSSPLRLAEPARGAHSCVAGMGMNPARVRCSIASSAKSLICCGNDQSHTILRPGRADYRRLWAIRIYQRVAGEDEVRCVT